MSLRRALLAMAVLAALVPRGIEARADSTIITTQPVQGAPYSAGPIRDNFGRAAADINSIERMNAGASAPASPSTGTLWLETPGSGTTRTLRVWVGSATAWVPIARIDSAAGAWMPPVGGGAIPSIVSAATTNLGSVPQAALQVTGSQSIASFGSSVPEGQVRFLVFTGSPTLVYNATYMILPGAANIALTPGETAIALSLGAGKWRVGFGSLTGCGLFTDTDAGCVPASGGGTVNYLRADGTWAAPAGSGTVTSITFTGDGTVLSSTPTAPVTTSGTLAATLNTQIANRILAGPATAGPSAPTFRALVSADLPAISCTDLSNDGTACQANTGTSGHTLPFLDTANNWDAPQRGKQGTVAISTATFTPNLNLNQHFSITLVNAACPCTIANPSNIASAPGQVGMLKIIQSATGSDTIGSWGGDWKFAGGSAPTLSTAANAIDQFSYYVDDATHIVLSPGLLDVK